MSAQIQGYGCNLWGQLSQDDAEFETCAPPRDLDGGLCFTLVVTDAGGPNFHVLTLASHVSRKVLLPMLREVKAPPSRCDEPASSL